MHRLLYHLIYFGSNHSDFILSIKVFLYDFISFNESIEFSLQVLVLISQQISMALERLQFLLQVVVPVKHSIIAVTNTL